MEEPRKHIFDAAREAKLAVVGLGLLQREVEAGDAWMDQLGLPRDGGLLAGLRASTAAVELIKEYEGLRLHAYLCPAKVWTIGWGATGAGIYKGVVWTLAQAERRLAADIAAVEEGVRFLLGGMPCTQGQFDALTSFAFNCGLDIDNDHTPEGLGDSTLMKRHLAGDYQAAEAEFHKWVNGGGKKLAGLVRRRKDEARLYRGQ